MSQPDATQLKKYFHEDMIKAFKETAKAIKYKPTRRLDLINKYGGYEAAIKILPTDSNTFDFTLLWEAERLDLSIEALVTKGMYQGLFPSNTVQFCQKRLDEYNYAPKKLTEVVEEPEITPYVEEHEQGHETETQKSLHSIDTQSINDFIDTLFEEGLEIKPKDVLSRVLDAAKWQELWNDEKIFTEANQDLLKKVARYEGTLTPTTLSELEGYNEAYPLYNVINTLVKRIKRTTQINLEEYGIEEKACWRLLFQGECEGPKAYRWVLKEGPKAVALQA